MVTFPALIRSGSDAQLCASLLSPNETLLMSIFLTNGDEKEKKKKMKRLLHQETSNKNFHRCFQFQVSSSRRVNWQPAAGDGRGEWGKSSSNSKLDYRVTHLE